MVRFFGKFSVLCFLVTSVLRFAFCLITNSLSYSTQTFECTSQTSIHQQVFLCCISLEANAQSFRKLLEASFNFMFLDKFATQFFLEKSFPYERNYLLYNKVINILKKK